MRAWKVGEKVNFVVNEWDTVGTLITQCVITEVHNDYAVATELYGGEHPMRLLIDDDTEDMFRKA